MRLHPTPRAALGCMRLSTEPERDPAAAEALLHAAFDAGIDLLDTADAYCRDESEAGHNERLIARALASWRGDRTSVHVATKGGLTRPAGRWEPDGRARALAAACEASLRALGTLRHFVYQLHAPDPRVPLATSVRALRSLQRGGLVEHVGLCNVSLKQLEEALRITEIAAVQVELGPFRDDALWSGLAARCAAEGIVLLAYRPLGGPQRRQRLGRDETLLALASRHGATPAEIALAWLRDLSPSIVPLFGATRVESLRSSLRALEIRLGPEDRARLDERFPAGRLLREGGRRVPPRAKAREGEVVLVMGLPAAGKSTLARELVEAGYARLNRDEHGGRLASLVPALDALLASGQTRVVLDNTYATRKSRAAVVAKAAEHGVETRCVWLRTSVADAQRNAIERMLVRHGRLLEPEELRAGVKGDPGAFPPGVPLRYERDLEPPDPGEGFSRIDVVPFTRRPEPGGRTRALLVWLDGVVWKSRSGSRTPMAAADLELLPGAAEALTRHAERGFELFGFSWQPEVAAGRLSREALATIVEELRARLGRPIRVAYCPHAAGPARCWCRKPLPGLLAELAHGHGIDKSQSLFVGRGRLDESYAASAGLPFSDATSFFAA